MGSTIADTPLNKRAGRKLREIREELELEQKEFAVRLSKELGLEIKAPAYSNYEGGKRPVPAAILLAATKISGKPIFVDAAAEQSFAEKVARIVRGEDPPAAAHTAA